MVRLHSNMIGETVVLSNRGDIISVSGCQFMNNGRDWILVDAPRKQNDKRSLLDELQGESQSDILEIILLLMIQKGIVKDVDEFKDVLSAAKLARTLTE